jgi:hypothetical protein
MNKIKRTYIPSVSIAFTCSVVFSAIINIANGYDSNGYFSFILQLLVFLIGCVTIDAIICKTPIANSYLSHLIVEAIVLYSTFMLVSYFFHWFGFHIDRVIIVTLIFFFIYAAIQFYFFKLYQLEADQINQLIEKQKRY